MTLPTRLTRAAVSVLLAVLCGAAAVTVARAFADAAKANTGNGATAASVKAEGAVTASVPGGAGSTVNVSWASDTLSDNTPVTYYVLRNGAMAGGTCAGLQSSATTSCQDKLVPPGATTYKVVPNYSPSAATIEWVGTAGASAPVTVPISLRINSLTVVSATQGTQHWNATVTVTVTDQTGAPVSGVSVNGSWSPTALAVAQSDCGATTGASGQCTVVTKNSDFPIAQPTETWTVAAAPGGLSKTGDTYTGLENVESSVTANASGSGVGVALLGTATDTTASHTTTSVTLSATPPANSTVVVLIYREAAASGDSVTSVGGTAITSASLITVNAPFGGSSTYNEWAYAAKGVGAGTVSVTFSQLNAATEVDVLGLSGDDTASSFAQFATTGSSAPSTSATATLTSPSSGDGEVVLIGTVGNTAGVSIPASWTQLEFAHAASPAFGVSSEFNPAAQASVSFTLGTSDPWGTIALEIRKSQ